MKRLGWFVVVLASAVAGAETREEAWQKARRDNNAEAYANYLYRYPDSPEVTEAFRSLARASELGRGRVTDVPLVPDSGPFTLDAFFALDAQRRGKATTVTEALARSAAGRGVAGHLTALVEDPDPAVRVAAVDLLWLLDDLWWFRAMPLPTKRQFEEAVAPALHEMLGDKESSVAPAAAYALWELNGTKAAEPLIDRLSRGKTPALRRAAADVLGLLGGAAAVEPLATAIGSDQDTLVRAEAAESLGEIGDARAVPALAAALARDQQEEVRIAAAVALRAVGDAGALQPLAVALKADKSPAVRRTAACALGTTADPSVVPVLAAALKDEDQGVRLAAAQTLGPRADRQAVEPLLTLLATERAEPLRTAAIDALGATGDPRAVEPVVGWLCREKTDLSQSAVLVAALSLRAVGDARAAGLLLSALSARDPHARARAALALGVLDGSPKAVALLVKEHGPAWYCRDAPWPGQRISDPRIVPRLISALQEEDAEVLLNAAVALGMVGDAQAVEPLVALLKRERNVRVREAVVGSLGMIGGAPAKAALVRATEDSSPRVLLRAVDALREVKDPRAFEALTGALGRLQSPGPSPAGAAAAQDDPAASPERVHKAILEALAAGGDPRAVDTLVASLGHKSPQVRESAAQALGALRHARALQPLLAALKDESSWVREKSAVALGKVGDPKAVVPLLGLLDDQAPEVCSAALGALALLPHGRATPSAGERLLAAPLRARYHPGYWTTLFCLGWRPQTREDWPRLLAARDQRVLLSALWPTTKKVLLADAAVGDSATVPRIAELLILLGRDEVVGDLVSLLQTKGTKNLAVLYYGCGKKELQEAAAAWARDRGKVELHAHPPHNDVQWGAL